MKTIPIETPDDFDDVAADILDEFTSSFDTSNGCIEEVTGNGTRIFSDKGQRLYERYQDRLRAVGEKLFPGEGEHMRIKAWMVCDDPNFD